MLQANEMVNPWISPTLESLRITVYAAFRSASPYALPNAPVDKYCLSNLAACLL
jgi:hypothetical protein